MQLQHKYEIVPFTRGKGIEVNPDRSTARLFAHFVGCDEDQLHYFVSNIWDFVYTERIESIKKAWRVIKPGGYLVTYSENIKLDIDKGFEIILALKIGDKELTVLKKRADKSVNVKPARLPDKSVCVVRYGGIGDMIQTSSIFPYLKDQGYHVVVNTDPQGFEIIKEDPYIDDFIIQDKGQVPNHELKDFWDNLKRKFLKFINLSESVEGTFLALPQRITYQWPHEVRHERMNVNYMEHIHALAGVPLPPKSRFYPSKKEKLKAEKVRKKINGRLIVWTLAGSSIHKHWPFLDQIVARLMVTYNDVYMMLVGDGLCQLLERGWENEPRVILKSGKMEKRDTLSIVEYADLVIGPETGILGAVSMMDIPKIILLSHSSVENLTKYWINCHNMEPEGCMCYPCHQMHHGYNPCIEVKEMGAALCQTRIDIEKVWFEIMNILGG